MESKEGDLTSDFNHLDCECSRFPILNSLSMPSVCVHFRAVVYARVAYLVVVVVRGIIKIILIDFHVTAPPASYVASLMRYPVFASRHNVVRNLLDRSS